MFVDRLIQQVEMAEARFREYAEQRAARIREIRKMDQGRFDEVNISVLDDHARVNRRLALSSLSQERTALEKPPQVPSRTRAVLLERIIKTNELISSAFLIEGERTRKTVGRVVIRGSSGTVRGFGTGSMVSPQLMMTNNHVLDSASTAANSTIQFDYVERFDGTAMDVVEFTLDPDDFFETDETLDFTIVAVNVTGTEGESLTTRGWVPLIAESGKAVVGERVNIIQHPGGKPQQVALRQNRIIDVLDNFLHYAADTHQGSSGSPVASDMWQTAALHHAGVPRRDGQGKILLVSGLPWDGSAETVNQIDWKANEGTRISKVVEELKKREASMSVAKKLLLAGGFSPPGNESVVAAGPDPDEEPSRLRIDKSGRIIYRIPVEMAIGIPDPCESGEMVKVEQQVNFQPTPSPAAPVVGKPSKIEERDRTAARAAVQAHESEEYYDEVSDREDIDEYYQGIAENENLVDRPLFNALNALLIQTHTITLSYKSARLEHLYPWVDLHPDRQLQSIYSGEGFDAEEVVRQELEVEALRESMLARFMTTEAAANPEVMGEFLEELEASAMFNCEHVVPQSWFAKKSPMKTDLHHLFTCEPDCNSFRSNIPYFEFPPEDEAVRLRCGRRETNDRFEPTSGKGPAARATLYFLIRYKGLVGDEARELQAERLPILLNWHANEPVTLYEKHRNAAIRAAQGNRNPLIDFPDWAESIDFLASFAI